MAKFCGKYLVLMELLLKDKELNKWCRNYSAYVKNTEHLELERIIYDSFVKDAYQLPFMADVLHQKAYSDYKFESALSGTDADLIHGIFVEIRSDYGSNGRLINRAIAEGNLYGLMKVYLSRASES